MEKKQKSKGSFININFFLRNNRLVKADQQKNEHLIFVNYLQMNEQNTNFSQIVQKHSIIVIQ